MSSRNEQQSTRLYLVGFRIEPDIYEPQLYTIYVDDDRPILWDSQPIVFARPDLAPSALAKSNCGAVAFGPAPTELYVVLDFADAIYTLNLKDEADSDQLLNCVNVLLDFANCIKEEMPGTYRSSLEKLADHLTFNSRFADFLSENHLSRRTLTDGIYWLLGMIVYQMKIVT